MNQPATDISADHRTLEQKRNHYEVEKEIATRLKAAGREERKTIYKTMYDELFEKVPDHPRASRRENPELTRAHNQNKIGILKPFIDASTVLAEVAPGDCRFAADMVCPRVKTVYGIDISDQRGSADEVPDNFHLIIYDGYDLDMPDASVDVVWSDQLLEHFHPEDTELHLATVRRILKPGGKYVFRTPHRFTGPHDISRFFSDTAECFHLKEWTNLEFAAALKRLNFSSWRGYRNAKGILVRLPFIYFHILEPLVDRLPGKLKRKLARTLFSTNLIMVAIK